MAEAPEAVVRRVQEVQNCVNDAGYCAAHDDGFESVSWTERGCALAVAHADAAFTASLEWAAERLAAGVISGGSSFVSMTCVRELRRLAGEES